MPHTQRKKPYININFYTCMGYVIIHKRKLFTHTSRCRRFDLLLFGRFGSVCCRYDSSCRSTGCHRFEGSVAINRDRRYRHFGYRCFDESRGDSFSPIVFGCFSPIKNYLLELRCELVRGRNGRRYELLEISPETIVRELQN